MKCEITNHLILFVYELLVEKRIPSRAYPVRILPSSTSTCLSQIHGSELYPILDKRGSLQTGKVLSLRFFSSDAPDVPHIKVTLPALSPTMEVGTIVSWEKKEGDQLSEGDLLCEIETDKATMGFETPEEGYLAKVLLPAGSKDVPIGRLLCVIVEDESNVEKFKGNSNINFVDDGSSNLSSAPPPSSSKPTSHTPVADSTPPPPARSLESQAPLPISVPKVYSTSNQSGSKRPFASPAAKRIAMEKSIDISQISSGSGMDGMIVAADVEAFKPIGGAVSSGHSSGLLSQGSYTDAELTTMRRTIAKRLQSSKHEIPHYYLSVEITMDSVMSLRKEINTKYDKEGIKLINSAWMGDFIREYHSCDVSVAVDTGSGLITPIISSAETKGLAEISESIKEMAGRAKEGKLQPHEFMGGTITVSNLGMFGISNFTAIINPPQSCILAVGGTTQKAMAKSDGTLGSTNVMKVTLSCDHRVVDGAVGAQWLQHFKKFIENPTSMLL
ncbi:DLAT [Lepeophtheirus salmonis]|uniref:Dihydrolipoamide acetyltransferase component of pyruvate dehydrogenase complex n=1 Tax=Lepeophtheirus salmonis TaxID=72036 RepID=A0A7R8CIF3_LEPSM|nr:DLAT [Lepeophtheirus salmonis]CAF2777607.1 DLAT [Lepeophtheirus salmonis]